MTASSELFISESVMEPELIEKIKKKFPDYDGYEFPSGWRDIWDDADFPSKGEIELTDGDGKVIGVVTFEVEFEVVKSSIGMERYIEAFPKNIKIKKVAK